MEDEKYLDPVVEVERLEDWEPNQDDSDYSEGKGRERIYKDYPEERDFTEED